VGSRGLVPDGKAAAAIDLAREELVRGYLCPSCGQEPGLGCRGRQCGAYSHTSRYDLAAADGLVPPLPPRRGVS